MRKATNPVDISTGNRSAKKAHPRKRYSKIRVKQNGQINLDGYTPNQRRAIELICLGNNVSATMTAMEMNRSTFYTWTRDDSIYAAIAQRARGTHIAHIDDLMHEVDADARALIHRIIVSDEVSPATRLRAALACLNRPQGAWLPKELPPCDYEPEIPPEQLFRRPMKNNPNNDPSEETEPQETEPAESERQTAQARRATPSIAPVVRPGNESASAARPPQPHASTKPTGAAVDEQPQINPPKTSESVESQTITAATHQLAANQSLPAEQIPEMPPQKNERSVEFTPIRQMHLDTAFLSRYTVLEHECAENFDRLLNEMAHIYNPQSAIEELQVLRITQAHWSLRRIETMETAVMESTINEIRNEVPNTNPAAALASVFLQKEPEEIWFFDRMRDFRKIHESYLERQESQLFKAKERRELSGLRKAQTQSIQRKHQRLQAAGKKHQIPLEAQIQTAFQSTLIPEKRAAPR